MSNKTFAYARVSSIDQNLDRQLIAIKEFCQKNGIELSDRDIFTDKKTGKDIDRKGYQALKQCLRSGDTIIIKELDRLARNKSLIKKELNYFKDNNIRVKVLNIPTTLVDFPKGQEWVLEMVNNILIEVLSAIAEEERVKIRTRQAEGIAAAKSKGIELGRPKAKYPKLWEMYYTQWKAGHITAKAFMESVELKRTTFYKLVKQFEEESKK